MRLISTKTMSFSAILLAIGGCGQSDSEPAEPSEVSSAPTEPAAPEVAAEAALDFAPRFGGVVARASDFIVELLPSATGSISAHVYGADAGEELTADAAALKVSVKGEDGETHEVDLQWDAGAGAYVGSAGVPLAAGPVGVEVVTEEATAEAQLPQVLPAPVAQGGGTIVLAGEMAAEVRPEVDGTVKAVVLGGDGMPVGPDADVAVQVGVAGAAPVALTWDAEAELYAGRLPTMSSGALSLSVTRAGTTYRGGVARIAVAPEPSEGAKVVIAGDHSVEVIPMDGPNVQAVVVGPSGAPVAGTAGAELTIQVGAEPVAMSWDAQASKWVGTLAAPVVWATTPVTVNVVANGRRRVGRFGRGLALGHRRGLAADVEVSAGRAQVPPGAAVSARARGGASAMLNRPSVMVNGPSIMGPSVMGPSVMVQVRPPTPPSVMVNVRAPTPPMVEVRAPTPPRPPSVMGGVSVMAGFMVGR